MEETQKPDESFDKKYWRKIFIASWFLAVLADPLFLYVPILMDDFKCLMLDPKLKIAALLLRIVTDLFYLMDIIIRIYRHELFNKLDDGQNQMNFGFRWKSRVQRIAKTIWASNDILTDIVALLPLTQVAILIFFSKMSDLRYMTKTRMVIMNIFVLSQYVPRVFRIYLLFRELQRTLEKESKETSIWVKGVLNISMYLMASHVLGAMWYFIAIQQMMKCWHFACRKDDGCDNRIFRCHDHHAFRNTTILNDSCPLISSDTVPFDLGIFATVLQYGIVGSTNYFRKFSNCFCWGLQNLSSFGSNLHPSADGWENLYTALVSIIGLLLFLCLIGNLQMYMQIAATRRENHKHKMVMERKMKEKGREIELLLLKNGNRTSEVEEIKSRIMGKVEQALKGRMNADWDDILPLLPPDLQSHIKQALEGATSLAWLKKVPMLKGMDEGLLKIIYGKLEPVKYTESNFIIQKDQTLEKMVYIVDGEVSIEERSSDDSRRGAGQLFGEELLRWPFYSYLPDRKPSANESVKAISVVEALALNAEDLQSIYRQADITRKEELRHRKMMKEVVEQQMNSWIPKNGIPERKNKSMKSQIMENLSFYWDSLPSDWYNLVSRLPPDFQNEIKSYMPLTKLKEMPKFQNMEESVLKQICSHLRPMKYYNASGNIFQGDDSFQIQMLLVVDGYISDQSFNEKGPGEIYGEELLVWPFLTSFPGNAPTAAESPYAVSECTEVLVLTATYIERVAAEFRKHFIKNYGRLAQKLRPSSSEAVLRFFTEKEIEEATANYSCSNYKNEGGNVIVYEAALHGTALVIKTCNSATIGNPFIQSQHLVHEAFVLSQIRHENVVRLLGCCLETEWPIMVYDRTYAGTLYEHIHTEEPKLLLESRMKIAAETAGALKYLHSMSVIHRDVKTANILIDHTTHTNYTAKLSGFGASRLLLEDEGETEYVLSTLAETRLDDGDKHETEDEVWDEASPLPESWREYGVSTLPESSGEAEVSTLPGTTGYSDPESHVLTEKSDVYSFGVVLVELLTSQEAVSSDEPERFLANDFVCSVQEDRLRQMLDGEVIKDEFSFKIAEQVSELAMTCLRSRGEERPSMEEVAEELDTVVQTIMNREDNNMSSAS